MIKGYHDEYNYVVTDEHGNKYYVVSDKEAREIYKPKIIKAKKGLKDWPVYQKLKELGLV